MTTTTGRRTRRAVNNDWQTQGACRPLSSELFFPIGQSLEAQAQEQLAKDICRTCPVRNACLEWALATKQDSGVWGGLSEADRRALLAQRAAPISKYMAQVAVANELVAEYGPEMLAWHKEGLALKIISQRLSRRPGRTWVPEDSLRSATKLAFQQMGVALESCVSIGTPAQDRVVAAWNLVQDMQARGVGQKKIAEAVGVGVGTLRAALKIADGADADPVAVQETSLAVAA